MESRREGAIIAAVLALAACGHDPGRPEPAPSAAAPATATSAAPAPTPEPSASAAPSVSASAAPPAGPPEGMLAVPAGIYLQGGTNGHGGTEERPAHEGIVPALWVDRTEVTAQAYLACMKAGACTRPHDDPKFGNIQGDAVVRPDHPINCIDYGQAEAYCRFAGKRLPTEREWEYFAKGGSEQRHYSWGEADPTPKIACYFHSGTCPVASFPPGAFGLYDVSGNVWEWTSSWFGDYPDELETGRHRVYRGGSWSRRFPKWLTNTLRNRFLPTEYSASLGVRCVKTVAPLTCPADTEARDGKCVRVKGAVLCDVGLAWNGSACAPGGAATAPAGVVVKSSADAAEPAVKAPPAEEQPVTRTRTPDLDADCQRYYPKTPAAYLFKGGTFHKRNGPLEGSGCKRRDVSVGWTSACCPG